MARINLFVPDDLKKKMELRPDINWSAEFRKLVENITKRDWLIVT